MNVSRTGSTRQSMDPKSSTTTPTTTALYNKPPDLSKLDILAGKILQSCGLPKANEAINHNDGDGITIDDDDDWKNLITLEKALDIYHPLPHNTTHSQHHDDSSSNGTRIASQQQQQSPLLTCTEFHSLTGKSGNNGTVDDSTNNHNQGSSSAAAASLPKYWTPPISNNTNDNNTITTSVEEYPQKQQDYYEDIEEIPCLEEMAPFSSKFYNHVGQFLIYAYNPSVFSNNNPTTTTKNTNKSMKEENKQGRDSNNNKNEADENCNDIHTMIGLEKYSLPRDVESVRVTKILCAFMELNVYGDERKRYNRKRKDYIVKNSTNDKSDECDDDEEAEENEMVTFLDVLLYHLENNTMIIESSLTGDNSNEHYHHHQSKKHSLPLIHSIFKHFAALPELEATLRTMVRRLRNNVTPLGIQNDNTATTMTSSTTTTTTTPTTPSVTNSGIRLAEMKTIQEYQTRLEGELEKHISSMEYIIGTIYKISDVKLRQKCRIKIGNVLQTFLLNSNSNSTGGGPGGVGSFSLVGGAMGIENTSATGIDCMLRILLRILHGIVSSSSSSSSKVSMETNNKAKRDTTPLAVVHESYRQLLLCILLPLHKPSSMVLWRDQTPLLGLYHKPLVQCIGALLRRDKGLIGEVIQHLLHPDIWPLERKGSRAMANTPKVVLLLHEIDTYITLLGSSSSSSSDTHYHHMSDTSFLPLVLRLAECIASDNSRSSERALEFFKNKVFVNLVQLHLSKVLTPLLRSLCRVDSGMEVPWNPTVRKRTLLVLQDLESSNKEVFCNSCNMLFDTNQNKVSKTESSKETTPSTIEVPETKAAILSSSYNIVEGPSRDMVSLRKAMGTWKPPTSKNSLVGMSNSNEDSFAEMPPPPSRVPQKQGIRTQQPPSTITGVAPWATESNTGRGSRQPRSHNHMKSSSFNSSSTTTSRKSVQPPLTVTGVAPWAMRGGESSTSLGSRIPQQLGNQKKHHLPQPQNSRKAHDSNHSLHKGRLTNEGGGHECEEQTNNDESLSSSSGLMKVHAFIEKLKPPKAENDEGENDGISSWVKTQMQESPVLLPHLKFHDLVFGQTLGTGAFSTVRYVRQIIPNKTRSSWPEYAVKIVSTKKIEELGYEQSINREIAILRLLCHPGISRLVSSFRFRDGAYLVLEYASGGDLHGVLKRNGSLNEDSTRFVVGEIVSALFAIHEMDLVYVDLKPENVLVTKSGHIKLTDFGGCRPVTSVSRDLVKQAAKNVLDSLRDGDWKISADTNSTPDTSKMDYSSSEEGGEDKEEEEEEEDTRIEGTTAYLSPEVVMGGYPTKAADSWALGCVFFQCISGRPPILEDNDASTKERIVSFNIPSSDSSPSETSMNTRFFLEEDGSRPFSDVAKRLILKLLSRNPLDRPSMLIASEDDFFEDIDIFTLYKNSSHRLDVGSVAPVADSRWSRRQFSSIWAPQPEAYSLGVEEGSSRKKAEMDTYIVENTPILEGDEADAPFLISTQPQKMLFKICE